MYFKAEFFASILLNNQRQPTMSANKLQAIIEAALMVAEHPLSISSIQHLFKEEEEQPSTTEIKAMLTAICDRHKESGIELQEVASGYRLQAKVEFSPWLSRLWEERPPRYSRAFLETLAIIAYRQPITRAEIEQIRGVTVSSNIMKALLEREWVKVLGYRELPGKPAVLGTTKTFLDHFNLKSLTELPTLAEFKNFETQDRQIQVQLALENSRLELNNSEVIPEERNALLNDDDSDGVLVAPI
ncbi:MAG: SMC-Scp complex subunit ScpB [Gammaproteobacteria bacterium RIFCSPHIGHO2_12_FULL_37_34]|nr:MAG: SMC-Scp complex subunit ScpB [Gammaproteobacteria bacterium RIFCSPHIGHO2_12_FULL_37_34]